MRLPPRDEAAGDESAHEKFRLTFPSFDFVVLESYRRIVDKQLERSGDLWIGAQDDFELQQVVGLMRKGCKETRDTSGASTSQVLAIVHLNSRVPARLKDGVSEVHDKRSGFSIG